MSVLKTMVVIVGMIMRHQTFSSSGSSQFS